MTIIPFDQQQVRTDPIERLQHKITQGEVVFGHELLQTVEVSIDGRLDPRLREIILASGIRGLKQRGRPRKNTARVDFALEELDAAYPKLLRKFQREAFQNGDEAKARGDKLPVARYSPSELAYKELAANMSGDFDNIDGRSLATLHSAWKNNRFHSTENDTDSEDFDAEIEQRFPTPPRS